MTGHGGGHKTSAYPQIRAIQESFRPGESEQSHYVRLLYPEHVDLMAIISFLEGRDEVVYAERNRRLGRKEASRETDMEIGRAHV